LTILYFPENPTHGDIFELEDGVLYQYDATVNAWIKIASNTINLPLATTSQNGAMSASDLQKLNRLVIPPPTSSIIGNDCVSSFDLGTISLQGVDDFVNVEGNVSVQNIDDTGTHIATTVPFHIHQHTYGFDFNLDLVALIDELKRRNQFNVIGPAGLRGNKGQTGDPGEDYIPSGPQGVKGDQGLAPECILDVQTEVLQAKLKPGLKRALTSVRIKPNADDDTKYELEFDRQVVGKLNATTSLFKVKQQKSSWILAVASTAGVAQQVYYLDIDPIIEAIHAKFLSEVNRLKAGYEDITKFWVQTMSDLFDEQKAALCCALEFCMSKTKSEHLRRHMEIVAATALPDARIEVNTREEAYSNSIAQLESGTSMRPRIGSGPDLCAADLETAKTSDANPQGVQESNESLLVIDPILHIEPSNATTIDLPKGVYTATISSFGIQVDGKHFANLILSYASGGKTKTIRFLNKGVYTNLIDAKAAYEGLSVAFDHDGGQIGMYLHLLPTANASGNIIISVKPEPILVPVSLPSQDEQPKESLPSRIVKQSDELICDMDINHLSWYERGWRNNQCCGVMLNLYGQDYIIVKRSIGSESCCGGGESLDTPCLAKLASVGHPAFAWPTLDGANFAPLPNTSAVTFQYNEHLNILAATKIANGEFSAGKGNPPGARHLSFQLDFILFPLA